MPVVIINASTKLALPNWLNKTITRQIASAPLVRAGVATDAIDANLSNGECFNIIAKNMVNTMLINGSNATISSNKETAKISIIEFPPSIFRAMPIFKCVYIYNRLNCSFIIIQLLRYVNIVMKISKILCEFLVKMSRFCFWIFSKNVSCFIGRNLIYF